MKKLIAIILAGIMTCLGFVGLGNTNLRNLSGKKVKVSVDEKEFTISLYNNTTANDFYEKLPITITANDYPGYDEKVCRLGDIALSMENAPAGDCPRIPEVGYYEPGNWIAIYYGFIGYWSGKVPLGKIDAGSKELESITDGAKIIFEAEATDEVTSESVSTTNINNDSSTEAVKKDDSSETNINSSSKPQTEGDNMTESTNQTNTVLKTTTYNLNGIEFKMILVESGTFTMGSDNQKVEFSESPAHKVTLSRDYLIGETEVTEALWNAVMGNGGGSNSMPKTSVTWSQTHDFIDRLNRIAHEQGLIPGDVNFILPTEAQWEFAAKGGNASKGYIYSGSNNIGDVAVTYENSGSNSPIQVKSKAPNELGIYDMSGNAYEWVDDYGANYSSGAQTDPHNTSGKSYVKRGGSNYHSFSSEPYLFTTTGRYFYGSTDWTIGFRIGLQ